MNRAFILAVTLSASGVLPAHRASAQQTRPDVRKILDTGSESVGAVAVPASGRFIVYSDDHAIRIYNRQSQKTTTVPVPVVNVFGDALSISRSGARLIFPVNDDTRRGTYIWMIDLDTLTGVPRSEPHRVSIRPTPMASISSDGRWIAFVPSDGVPIKMAGTRLMVMPSDGGEERVLDSARIINTPRWTPDGKTIFYVRQRALARISASGGSHDSLGVARGVIGVSPNGKYIAFIPEGGSTQTAVQIADVDGTVVGRIPFNSADEQPYMWTPSGNPGMISFRRLEPATLKTISLADGRLSAYPITERYPVGPRFSPSGSHLGIIANVDGADQLVVYNLKTKQRIPLSTTVRPERYSWLWSPDGSRIAFLATNQTNPPHHELYVVDVATSRSSRLADIGPAKPYNATLFRWRSDGKAIDFITGAYTVRKSAAELRRVTLIRPSMSLPRRSSIRISLHLLIPQPSEPSRSDSRPWSSWCWRSSSPGDSRDRSPGLRSPPTPSHAAISTRVSRSCRTMRSAG